MRRSKVVSPEKQLKKNLGELRGEIINVGLGHRLNSSERLIDSGSLRILRSEYHQFGESYDINAKWGLQYKNEGGDSVHWGKEEYNLHFNDVLDINQAVYKIRPDGLDEDHESAIEIDYRKLPEERLGGFVTNVLFIVRHELAVAPNVRVV